MTSHDRDLAEAAEYGEMIKELNIQRAEATAALKKISKVTQEVTQFEFNKTDVLGLEAWLANTKDVPQDFNTIEIELQREWFDFVKANIDLYKDEHVYFVKPALESKPEVSAEVSQNGAQTASVNRPPIDREKAEAKHIRQVNQLIQQDWAAGDNDIEEKKSTKARSEPALTPRDQQVIYLLTEEIAKIDREHQKIPGIYDTDRAWRRVEDIKKLMKDIDGLYTNPEAKPLTDKELVNKLQKLLPVTSAMKEKLGMKPKEDDNIRMAIEHVKPRKSGSH